MHALPAYRGTPRALRAAGALLLIVLAFQLLLVFRWIPEFEVVFEQMGGKLPSTTLMVVNLSHFGVLAVLLAALDVALFAAGLLVPVEPRLIHVLASTFAAIAITVAVIVPLYLPQFGPDTMRLPRTRCLTSASSRRLRASATSWCNLEGRG